MTAQLFAPEIINHMANTYSLQDGSDLQISTIYTGKMQVY